MFLLRPGGGTIAWGGDGTNGYYAFVRNNQGSASQPSWNALAATAASGNIVIDGLENTYYNMQDQCRPSGWFGPFNNLEDSYLGGLNLTPGLLTAVARRGLCLPDTCLAGAGSATGSIPWNLTGGFGSPIPLDPPVENYSFTFQASNP